MVRIAHIADSCKIHPRAKTRSTSAPVSPTHWTVVIEIAKLWIHCYHKSSGNPFCLTFWLRVLPSVPRVPQGQGERYGNLFVKTHTHRRERWLGSKKRRVRVRDTAMERDAQSTKNSFTMVHAHAIFAKVPVPVPLFLLAPWGGRNVDCDNLRLDRSGRVTLECLRYLSLLTRAIELLRGSVFAP